MHLKTNSDFIINWNLNETDNRASLNLETRSRKMAAISYTHKHEQLTNTGVIHDQQKCEDKTRQDKQTQHQYGNQKTAKHDYQSTIS